MKSLKFITIVLLSMMLVACSEEKDSKDTTTQEEKKTEETTTKTETVEDTSDDVSEDTTEDTNETEKLSDEYTIGGEDTPILGAKSMEFLEEVKERTKSHKDAADITENFPKTSNYAVELDVLIEVQEGADSTYDAVITKALIDEKTPVKIYSENADRNTGVYSPGAYEENNKGYVYDGQQWNEIEIPAGKHVVFGLANVVTKMLNHNTKVLEVTEDADTYFLEYAGEENELTKQLSELFNFTYEGANMETLVYNLIASVDKDTNELTDFIILSKVNGFKANEHLQIEVYGEYEDYGAHPKETIKKPDGL